jgi:folate-binding protein YgfZ
VREGEARADVAAGGDASVAASGGRLERGLSRILARGSERRDFLDRMATNDLSKLAAGQGAPTFLLERTGRVVDRLVVLERGEEALLLGSAGRGAAALEWLAKYVIADDVTLSDVTEQTRLVTVLGQAAPAVLERGFGLAAGGLTPWDHRRGAPPFRETTIVRAEDVGGKSFHVIAPCASWPAVEEALSALPVVSEGAYRALRIAAGVPAFGEEFTERSIPLELRALDHISFTKGCYVGQEVIARLHNFHRVKRALARLSVEGDAPPARGAELRDGDEVVGTVASAARLAGATYALAFLEAGRETPGRPLVVQDGVERRAARILTLTPSGDPS